MNNPQLCHTGEQLVEGGQRVAPWSAVQKLYRLHKVNTMSTKTLVFFLSCVLIIASLSTRTSGQETSMIQSVERAIVQQTNDFRKSNQLRAVNPDEHLTQAAKKFAKFMASTGKYGHRANDMTPAERAE